MKVSNRSSHRLFFAIDFELSVKEQIAAWSESIDINGKRVDPNNYHITLQFIGNLPHHKLIDLIEVVEVPQIDNFDVSFSSVGYFVKPEILFLEIGHGKASIERLSKKISNNYRHLNIKHKDARAFVPHVTIAREVKPPIDPVYQGKIVANIKSFCLMESLSIKSGVHYETVEKWRLNTPSEKSIVLGTK